MSPAQMRSVCAALVEGGCRSVHIGGGEPFLDFDGLCELTGIARGHGIVVEYIETNAYWAEDEQYVLRRLSALKKAGADTLCISLDPYHAEFIPRELPLRLADICRRTGFGHFVWQGAAKGIRYGGRAVTLEAKRHQKKPLEAILREAASKGPCRGLASADHFHVDLYNRFIPPGCTGIAIPLGEAVAGLEPGRYPAFEALYTGGLTALLDLAQKKGFLPDPEGYPSVCNACFHIRIWLSGQSGFPELDAEHYTHALA
jgi:hypothetical protein